MTIKEKLISTFSWGFVLWLVGYIAGFILFFVMPKDQIGYVIAPFGSLLMIWVVLKKIQRPELMCYFGLGLMWTLLAIVLDYIFIVKLLGGGSSYYKVDVYLYYGLTFIIPFIVGYWKYTNKKKNTKLF